MPSKMTISECLYFAAEEEKEKEEEGRGSGSVPAANGVSQDAVDVLCTAAEEHEGQRQLCNWTF